MYEAGATAALEIALSDTTTEQARPEASPSFRKQARRPAANDGNARPGLTEAIVDALAEVTCARSKDLAAQLGMDIAEVRNELLDLEKLGIVYRTGQTRGTRWWLG